MKLLREPLVQFLLVGAALFLWFRISSPSTDSQQDRIVITEGLIEHLTTNFARTWQRPPDDEEMAGLIREYIRDEVAYREALAMGLDRDDSIVRRRLRQKLEFLTQGAGSSLEPDETELTRFLVDHSDAYAIDPEIAFFQVYLNPDRHDDMEEVVAATLAMLPEEPMALPPGGLSGLGDSLMLPNEIELAPLWQITRLFGRAFVDELVDQDTGFWTGPIQSGYGLHFVFLTEMVSGRIPPLAEVRDSILRDWRAEQTERLKESFYQALLTRYEVVYDLPANVNQEIDP